MQTQIYLIIELRVLLVVQDGCICLLGEQRPSWMTINALQRRVNAFKSMLFFHVKRGFLWYIFSPHITHSSHCNSLKRVCFKHICK